MNKFDKVRGILEFNHKGSAYLIPHNKEIRDIYVYKKNLNKAFHLDEVEIELIDGPDGLEGKVIDIIKRKKLQFTGLYQKNKKYAFVLPDSRFMFNDIFIPKKNMGKFQNFEKVLSEITSWESDSKNPTGKIVKSLGMPGEHLAEMDTIIYEYNLNPEFPEEVENEADNIDFSITGEEISKRKDYRNVLTFSIDPESARDLDDALSFQRLDNGNIEIGVHIADVSHYVTYDSELYKEASERGNSTYLVDRVIPMLPERLSNQVCSLNPHTDKLAYSIIFELDNDGIILNEWIGRTVINSDHRFSYEQALSVIENEDNDYDKSVKDAIQISYNLSAKIRKRRMKDCIEFNSREVRFVLDEDNVPTDVYFKYGTKSTQLIEEYMLLANRRIGNFLNGKKNIPWRVHDRPDEMKLFELFETSYKFGHQIKFEPDNIKVCMNKLLDSVKDTPEENMINQMAVRTQCKAEYSKDNIGHFGLGGDFKTYTHFTSPIRRFSDLKTHIRLTEELENIKSVFSDKESHRLCKHISKTEINSAKAERESIKFKQTEFMKDKVGKGFIGIVTGVKSWGVFVEIKENGCEGLVSKHNLMKIAEDDNEFLTYNLDLHRLGDEVMVIIESVDVIEKRISMNII